MNSKQYRDLVKEVFGTDAGHRLLDELAKLYVFKTLTSNDPLILSANAATHSLISEFLLATKFSFLEKEVDSEPKVLDNGFISYEDYLKGYNL